MNVAIDNWKVLLSVGFAPPSAGRQTEVALTQWAWPRAAARPPHEPGQNLVQCTRSRVPVNPDKAR